MLRSFLRLPKQPIMLPSFSIFENLRHDIVPELVDIMNLEGLVSCLPAYDVRETLLVGIFEHGM